MKWISVEDEQPQIDFEVICCIDDDVFIAIFRENNSGYWFERESDRVIEVDVTYWQPLPDPPA